MPPTATSRHLRTHPVRLAAFDLGSRPPATAHVAEDPLRAYPAPLGDVGLPTPFGPVRPSTFPACSDVCATAAAIALPRAPSFNALPRRNLAPSLHPHGSPRLAASPQLMPYASLRSPSASPPMSASPVRASPVRASPVTGFHFPPRPVSVTPQTLLPKTPTASFACPPSTPSALSALRASPPPAQVLPVMTPIVDASTSSVWQSSTSCSRQPTDNRSARRLWRHRPAHAVRLAALVAGAVHVRVVGAGFASSSLPLSSFMFTRLPTMTAMSCHARVTTAPTTRPVNVSVMTIMARQLHRGALCTSKQSTAPLRDHTACRACRMLSLGSPPSATSPALMPSASVTPVADTTGSVLASPLRLRPSPPSALRHPVLSIPLSAPAALLHEPPPACSARPPSVPSALPATQSPWRLPSAGFSGPDSPSLIPKVCPS